MNEKRSISVIIPTCNRKEVLKKCLKALFRQTYPRLLYEIVVVDDGSTDGTEKTVRGMVRRSPVPLTVLRQENSGPARARNTGIRYSKGDILLITGDDIIASKTLLDEHMRFHRDYPEDETAVLGYITWSSSIPVTPFMRYLENGGPQFRFNSLEHGEEVSFRYFVTSNISVKRAFLLEHGLFDEHFRVAAFEDTELAYRLQKKSGLRILYNANAMAWHEHPSELRGFLRRMEAAGRSAVVWYRKMKKHRRDYAPFFDSGHSREKMKNRLQKILFNEATSRAFQIFLPAGNGKDFTPARTALMNQLMYHHFRRGVKEEARDKKERSEVEIFLKLLCRLSV